MPHFRFDKDYNHKNADRSTTAFKAGYSGLITTAQAEGAKKAGAGVAAKDGEKPAEGAADSSGRKRP